MSRETSNVLLTVGIVLLITGGAGILWPQYAQGFLEAAGWLLLVGSIVARNVMTHLEMKRIDAKYKDALQRIKDERS